MSDILYSKLRLEVPTSLAGQNATIMNESGNTRTVELSSPITDIMLPGMEKYRVQAGYSDEYISLGYGDIITMLCVDVPWDPRGLNNNSWTTIQAYLKAGQISDKISIGNRKSFGFDGGSYTAEVVAINDGTGDAGEWYPKNTIDFVTTGLYPTSHKYNSSSSNTGGWVNSELRTWINSTLYNLLPSDLKEVIIAKSHQYEAGSYINNSWVSSLVTASDKLWLPTRSEVDYSYINSYTETTASNKSYYMKSNVYKWLNKSGGTLEKYWTSSPNINGDRYFWNVEYSANRYSSYDATSTIMYVPICFRI